MSRLTCILLLAALTLAACGEVEDTRPGQPVRHRQVAFKEILKAFEPMGTMLRTNRYDAEKFEKLAIELTNKREEPWSYFGPDTNYPPTKAKPEVWSKAAEFEQEKQAFLVASDKLLVAAKTPQRPQAEAAYIEAYDHCQSCHKAFREK